MLLVIILIIMSSPAGLACLHPFSCHLFALFLDCLPHLMCPFHSPLQVCCACRCLVLLVVLVRKFHVCLHCLLVVLLALDVDEGFWNLEPRIIIASCEEPSTWGLLAVSSELWWFWFWLSLPLEFPLEQSNVREHILRSWYAGPCLLRSWHDRL